MDSALTPTAPGASGDMTARVRAKDWSTTPLGPMERWPQSLRTAVGICLNSRYPMFVWWGSELVHIYNDAYTPILGDRHPAALGQSAPQLWREIWPLVAPQAEAVMRRGEASWNERVPLVLERNGFPEEGYFTWSYSAIPDEAGGVGGLLCVCVDETRRVRAEQERDRLAAQHQLALDAAGMGWWHYDPVTKISTWDERYKQIFGVTGHTRPNEEILRRLHPDDLPTVWAAVEAALDPIDARPYSVTYRIHRDDGSIRWIEAAGVASFEGNGPDRKATSLVGTVADITDRRRAEEQSRTILESITDAFFALDAGWRFTYANRRTESVFNRPAGEILGKVIWEEYPHLEGTEVGRAYLHAAKERVAACVTSFSSRHNRWYEVHIYPAAEGLSVYFRDVTDRKQAEAEREQLAGIVRASRDGIFAVGPDRRFVTWNPAAERLFGYTTEEVIGQDAAILVPPDRMHELDAAFERALNGEPMPENDTVRVRKDASLVDVSISVRPVLDANGRATAVGVTVRDITDRKIAEAAIQASEAKFRQLAETIPQLAWVARADGHIVWYNRRWYEYTGTVPEQMEGWGWQSVHDPAVLPLVLEKWAASIASSEPFEMVFPLRRGDGAMRPFLTLVAPLRDNNGVVVQWFGTNTDVTEERRAADERERVILREQAARAEAERASQMKDEFLATLSHELRTPLNAILGWAHILRTDGTFDPTDVRQGLETIERNARAQTKIIEDLLEMSRIVSGKVRLDVQRVDLPAVVRAAVDTIRHAADAKSVRLEVLPDADVGVITGDPARLQQVFWNLLSNSVKFSPRGARIRVQIERVGGHVEISVTDNGEGIKPEFLPHVFERFRQADSSTTRRHGGLGLGLAIVKQLVELHGGSVYASSPGEGLGATITVQLPLAPVAEAVDPTTDSPNPGGAGSDDAPAEPCRVSLAGLRVLVVDDELDARLLLKRLLEDCDAHAITAGSAAEALEAIRRDKPDVLVSDIGMATEDGFSLIARVRASPFAEGGSIPAIALTAYARSEDRTRILMAGFNSHLSKPLEPIELITTIASLTGRSHATEMAKPEVPRH